MADGLTPDDRIAELECKFEFQQETIDSLNETVTEQWTAIDRLTRRLDALTSKFSELAVSTSDGKSEPPPPHY